MSKRFSLVVSLSLVLALVVPVFLPVRSAQAAPAGDPAARIFVVHGINGLDLGAPAEFPVDVSVDGACALPNFQFGQITDGILLPPGTYEIAIRPANLISPCAETPVLGPLSLTFDNKKSYAVVAFLTDSGAPTAGVYELNTSMIRRGFSRIIAFHTAYAPTVDLRLGRNLVQLPQRSILVPNFSNSMMVSADVASGRTQAGLYLPGTYTVAFGPASLTLLRQSITLVFAVGNLSNGTFTLLTKVIR